MTNNNIKMVLVCKSVDWGGAASYGQGSHEDEHSSNSLSSLRKSYNRHLDGEKSSIHFNTVGLAWTDNFFKNSYENEGTNLQCF